MLAYVSVQENKMFTFNFQEICQLFFFSAQYIVHTEYKCVFYERENRTYSQRGQRASFVSIGESRGVCVSNHTTAFALVGETVEEKEDGPKRVSTHEYCAISISDNGDSAIVSPYQFSKTSLDKSCKNL